MEEGDDGEENDEAMEEDSEDVAVSGDYRERGIPTVNDRAAPVSRSVHVAGAPCDVCGDVMLATSSGLCALCATPFTSPTNDNCQQQRSSPHSVVCVIFY